MTRKEKIELLRGIASGRLKIESLTADHTFAVEIRGRDNGGIRFLIDGVEVPAEIFHEKSKYDEGEIKVFIGDREISKD